MLSKEDPPYAALNTGGKGSGDHHRFKLTQKNTICSQTCGWALASSKQTRPTNSILLFSHFGGMAVETHDWKDCFFFRLCYFHLTWSKKKIQNLWDVPFAHGMLSLPAAWSGSPRECCRSYFGLTLVEYPQGTIFLKLILFQKPLTCPFSKLFFGELLIKIFQLDILFHLGISTWCCFFSVTSLWTN